MGRKMKYYVIFVWGIICFGTFAFTTPARSETLVQNSLFQRIYVTFQVKQEAVQELLPSPWKAISVPRGPSEGSNLWVMFTEIIIAHDGKGEPIHGGSFCEVSLAVFGKNQETEEVSPFVTRIYWPYSDPSDYRNAVKAEISRETSRKISASVPGSANERWKVQNSAGGELEFEMRYQQTVPDREKVEFKVRSNIKPDFIRLYRDDYSEEIVKSIPAGINRIEKFKFRTTIPDMKKMFDGSEQFIGATVHNARIREAFYP